MTRLPRPSLRIAAPWLLLAAATLAVHGNALRGGFVWDDDSIIVENPATRDLSRMGEVLLSPDQTKPYYRPLNRASYLVDHRLFGMDPRAFHAVNVLVHLGSVLAFFGLCRRLFGATWPAFLAAALLAAHPIHVESVALVSARNNLFALAFAFGAIWLELRTVEERRHALGIASGLFFFLGLASKEQAAMVLPFLAVWLAFFPSAAPFRERIARLRFLAPHAVALGAYLAFRTIALGGPAATGGIGPGLVERLARNYYVLPEYLRIVVYPDRLSILRELPSDPYGLWWLPVAWIGILAALAALLRWPTPASTFGLLWFGLNLVPIVGLVPLPSTAHTVLAERFVHAAATGLWIVAADAVWRLVRDAPVRRAWAGAAACLILFSLGARSWVRVADWRDDLTLFQATARAQPRSVPAHFNIGVELKDRGDLEGARRAWEAALAIDPEDPGTHAQLGTLAAIQGRYDVAERHYRAALHGDPRLAEAAFNLARVLERSGRPREAVVYYRQVVESLSDLAPQARARLSSLEGFE